MNSSHKNNLLEKRFEADASDGFDLIHGSEEFFKSIKSPFNIQVKTGSEITNHFVLLELFIAITLLFTAKFVYFNPNPNELPLNSNEKAIALNRQPERAKLDNVTLVENGMVKMVENKINTHPVLPSSFSNALVADTSNILLVLNSNDDIEKLDTIIVAEPAFTFMYTDNKNKYKLIYVENLLVINYTDTLYNGIKLAPVLTGVPATYESKDNIVNCKNNIPLYSAVKTNGYLNDLNKPVNLLVAKKYESALVGFKMLLKNNPNDQNALFYGGLACYNLGEYTKAQLMFAKLKQLADPLFEEDVDWLMVKIYDELGQHNNANRLLKAIAHSNSFYRSKAIDELKK